MSPGYNKPTTSSTSRATNTGSREQTYPPTVQKRRNRFESPTQVTYSGEPKHAQLTSSPTDHSDLPALTTPEQSIEDHKLHPTDRRHPGYLQGKNPYGQVLDRIEHPYREPRAPVTEDKKSAQTVSEVGEHPDTQGVPESRPQASLPTPKPTDQQLHSQSQQPPFHTRGPISIRSAKNFFEMRSLQHLSNSPLPPSITAPNAKPPTRIQESAPPAVEGDVEVPNAEVVHTPAEENPDTEPPPHRRNESSDTVESSQFKLPNLADEVHEPVVDVHTRNAPSPPQVLVSDYEDKGPRIQQDSIGRRRSTNIFVEPPRGAKPLGSERVAKERSEQVTASHEPPNSEETSKSTDQLRMSDKAVRRPTACKSMAAAETSEAGISKSSSPQTEAQREKPSRNVRRAFEEDRHADHRPLKYCRLCGAALTSDGRRSERTVARRLSTISNTELKSFHNKPDKPITVRRKSEDVVSPGLSHDGASSPIPSRSNSASVPTATASIGIEARYKDIEVPEHVDNRQGYGRRVTQDFGFPGARIRPHGSTTKRPLQDPGKWVKRACGHFSYMGPDEFREPAQTKKCRQCLGRPRHQARSSCLRQTRERATSGSSTSNNCSLRESLHQMQNLSKDQCGDMLAKDLGKTINRILEEHASTLQDVINKIKLSQPRFGRGKRVSRDTDKQCQISSMSIDPLQSVHESDSNQCFSFPMIPPGAAERLNVGSYGQLGPNLNDSHPHLRQSIKTFPDLVHLVNSAADDFGLDLERKPTLEDEEKFRDAPCVSVSCVSISNPNVSGGNWEEEAFNSKLCDEDPWAQQKLQNFDTFSDACEQPIHRLDAVAEDPSAHPRSGGDFEPVFEHLYHISTQSSRCPKQLDEDYFGIVTEEIPTMGEETGEEKTSPLLMRTSTPSTLTSATSEHLQGFEGKSPREI